MANCTIDLANLLTPFTADAVMNGGATLVGAFVGAMFAFVFQITIQRRQDRKASLLSTHRILFCLFQQINTLVLIQKDFIAPFLNSPTRFISIPATYVGVNGSVFLRSTPDKGLGLGLKVGLKDMMTKDSPFERPTFAYLQTASGSTAKAKQQSFDGEDGYRVFVYSATDPAILKIIKELITTSKFSIGYNRREGGMDVLVPLDLMVVDSEYTANQKVIRTRSPEEAKGFSDCALKVIDDVIGKLGGK